MPKRTGEDYIKIGANPEHFIETGPVRIVSGHFAGHRAIRLESLHHPRHTNCGITVAIRGFIINLPAECVLE